MEDDKYIEWRNLIGAFMIRFAEVEFEIARALIDFSTQNYGEFKNLEFSKRVNKLRNFISNMELSISERSELHKIMDDLIELADIRNTIAHNPIRISLESIFLDTAWDEIRSLRNQESVVTLDVLSNKLSKLMVTEERLHELIGNATFEL
ncbi:hypothetical protein [Microbulbifer taiwanensis]|uniref:Cthe-2314-like HEPN domain-containing protein n=1 Tax=Microbulbifer taiwanensis TaxID=986746 RepID=A0ABW1YQZ3_9GAMM|nr:hypothetical protein [Microbulbifer taiwanensis]